MMGTMYIELTPIFLKKTTYPLLFILSFGFSASYDMLEIKRNIQLSLKRHLTNIRYSK
jgi:hypothetical protein